jgi:hypothetical protein
MHFLKLISSDRRNEYEYEVIRKIVDQVSNKINRDPLYVVDYPVGLKSRLLNIISFIRTILQSFLMMMKNYSVGLLLKVISIIFRYSILPSFLMMVIMDYAIVLLLKVYGKIVDVGQLLKDFGDEVSNKIDRVTLYVVKGKFSLSVSLYHCYLLFLFGIFIVFITFY